MAPTSRLFLTCSARTLCAAGLFVLASSASAGTITVGPGGPTPGCTLADAIAAANGDAASGACPAGSGADTIELTAGVLVATATDTTDGDNAFPSVTTEIALDGNGFTVARDPGAPDFRLFHVGATGDFTVRNVTLTGGRATAAAPGNDGGALYVVGFALLEDMTIENNHADSGGGGIQIYDGIVEAHRVLVANNTAALGGGLAAQGQTHTFFNSTFSGNTGTFGNAIYEASYFAQASLIHTTVMGDIHFSFVSITLLNSIVLGGCEGDGDAFNQGGSFSNDPECFSDPISEVDGVDIDLDLLDNGGPTRTHAIPSGSVVRNVDPTCGQAVDQRGYARDAACDSGAFDFDGIPPGPQPGCAFTQLLVEDGFESGDTSGWGFTRNPQGDLTVEPPAAMEGGQGLRVDIDTTGPGRQLDHYVVSTHADQDNVCLSFWLDPNSIQMPDFRPWRIAGGRDDNNHRLFFIQLGRGGGEYRMGFEALKPGGARVRVPFVPIPDGPVLVSAEWANSAHPSGGLLRLYIDGVLQREVSPIAGMTQRVGAVGIGNLGARPNSTGSIHLDGFEAGTTP